jgi:CubicO group peptidase (beta-lactamase class C family)
VIGEARAGGRRVRGDQCGHRAPGPPRGQRGTHVRSPAGRGQPDHHVARLDGSRVGVALVVLGVLDRLHERDRAAGLVGDHDVDLDDLAARLVAAGPPGAVVAVSPADGSVSYGVAGFAQTGVTRMSVDVRTDAASMTKALGTTAALMTLIDTGALRMDSEIRQLLEHRAGLWEWWPLYLTARGPGAVDLIRRLPLRYPPGTGRHYSDLGMILLGDLVSRVAGAPLPQAVQRLTLEPFGLSETAYSSPVRGGPVAASAQGDGIERTMVESGMPYPVGGDASAFSGWRSHLLVGEVNDGNAFHAFGGAAGHAGLFTTARDLLRFGRGILDSLTGAGPISAPVAEEFLTPGADPVQALGFRCWPSATGPVFGHGGFTGVAFGIVPARNAVIAMITNRLHTPGPPAATEALWNLVLEGIAPCV